MVEDKNIISLPSSLNYRYFKNYRYDLNGDHIKCDELQDKLEKRHSSIEKLCLELTGILQNFDKLKITSLSDNDHCSVVIYWMYDNLFSDIIDKKVHENIKEIIGNINNIWDNFKGSKECAFQGNLTDRDTFNKIKSLYYYALDYESIVLQQQNKHFTCTKEFSEYVNFYVQTYNKIKSECEQKTDEEYCTVLETIHKKRKKEDLSKLEPCIPLANEEPEAGNKMEDHREQEEDEAESEFPYIQSTSGSNAGISVVLPVLGILLISCVFYKFTPIGSWLRSNILKKVSTSYEVDGETAENILENPYEFSRSNSNGNMHIIGYQSMEN
ncbi:PIR Superfamily Protein [Plasmodium ovale wallikeri]|uniref:PIR Superfamily Protein n=1 Tax=Plasmodium ovale wallikeri TaxID=864142 RepID=A0A1A8YYW0_PLAOA|nr:PIR Superfamily Protein [Plasmodium ovale wallikeri]SBT57232.1 PIR Superfamily Protein [Plasmodium ovale wallikeri]